MLVKGSGSETYRQLSVAVTLDGNVTTDNLGQGRMQSF